MRWSALAAGLVGFSRSVAALEPIEAVGNKFFNKNGSQFFIKGICFLIGFRVAYFAPSYPFANMKQVSPTNSFPRTLSLTPPNANATFRS